VTPRRTFAVIQATTKSRVDLGLRLEHERPGGRLLAARDLGAATLRIPLTRPEDVDAEVLGWLRRAYQENAAPPPLRRSSRRPAPKLGTLTVVIEGASLPGLTFPSNDGGEYRNFHIGLATKSKERPTLAVPGKPWRAADLVPGDSPLAPLGVAGHRAARYRRLRLQRAVRARCPGRPQPVSRLGRRSRRRHDA